MVERFERIRDIQGIIDSGQGGLSGLRSKKLLEIRLDKEHSTCSPDKRRRTEDVQPEYDGVKQRSRKKWPGSSPSRSWAKSQSASWTQPRPAWTLPPASHTSRESVVLMEKAVALPGDLGVPPVHLGHHRHPEKEDAMTPCHPSPSQPAGGPQAPPAIPGRQMAEKGTPLERGEQCWSTVGRRGGTTESRRCPRWTRRPGTEPSPSSRRSGRRQGSRACTTGTGTAATESSSFE